MTVIGVTGSTGQVGGMVASLLSEHRPVLIVRDATRVPEVNAARIAVANYGDGEAAQAALAGIDVLFMVSAAESPNRREEHRTFIDSAAAAGVQHIVYTSFFGADENAVFTLGRDHADAEEAIRQSGMSFTLLRDNFYSDVLPLFADGHGIIRGPAADGRVSAVARADVADVATAILSDPADHVDTIYELTGPEALTLTEVATRASGSLGRTIRFENETVEQAYASRAHYAAPDWQLDAWVSTYTAIADGSCARLTSDVERLTGHPPRSLEQALSGD